MTTIKIVVEKHEDAYVSYPVGIEGIVVGQGDTFREAYESVVSALRFHIETFGKDVLNVDDPIKELYLAEAGI
jgi:predicted RNase H-like HicB family nuclease